MHYYEHQSATPILDGRYGGTPNTFALPVEDFQWVFASFAAELRDETLALSENLVRAVGHLMRDVSRLHISDERGREPETRYIVHELLSSTFRKLLGGHPSNTQSDNRLVWTYGRKEHPVGSAPLAIVEEKAKLGFGGDGAVQGSFAYAQHWTDPSQKVGTTPNPFVSLQPLT